VKGKSLHGEIAVMLIICSAWLNVRIIFICFYCLELMFLNYYICRMLWNGYCNLKKSHTLGGCWGKVKGQMVNVNTWEASPYDYLQDKV